MKRVGKITVLGVTVCVVVASVEEVGDAKTLSDDDYASYEDSNNTIYLNAKYGEPSSLQANLSHELMHVWFEQSGARYYLRTMLRMTSTEFEPVEETLIRMMSPALLSSLPGYAAVDTKLGGK